MDKRLIKNLTIVSGLLSLGGFGIWTAAQPDSAEVALADVTIQPATDDALLQGDRLLGSVLNSLGESAGSSPQTSGERVVPVSVESDSTESNPFATPRRSLPSYTNNSLPEEPQLLSETTSDAQPINSLRSSIDVQPESQAEVNYASHETQPENAAPADSPFGTPKPVNAFQSGNPFANSSPFAADIAQTTAETVEAVTEAASSAKVTSEAVAPAPFGNSPFSQTPTAAPQATSSEPAASPFAASPFAAGPFAATESEEPASAPEQESTPDQEPAAATEDNAADNAGSADEPSGSSSAEEAGPGNQLRSAPPAETPADSTPDLRSVQPFNMPEGSSQTPGALPQTLPRQGLPPQPTTAPFGSSTGEPGTDLQSGFNRQNVPVGQPASPQAPSAYATGINEMPAYGSGNDGMQSQFAVSPRTVNSDLAHVAAVGRPGARQLEGVQSPQIAIEKSAPGEIQVGKTALFSIRVRNTGNVIAQGVEIHDTVPAGTQLVRTSPQANIGPDGQLVWKLGELPPGGEQSVQIELTPMEEGEIGSVASVVLRAAATSRSVSTKPQLTLQAQAAQQVLIGEEVVLHITISNPGTGTATGVLISEQVPNGLSHTAGHELEFEVGELRPGETRTLELPLTAAQAGRTVNLLAARGDANLYTEIQTPIEVIAPGLSVDMQGPSKRYLERQATYTVSVSNPGTATAKDVELVTHLPPGLKFVEANNAGHYNPQQHSVTWSLEELPPAETGSVTLVTLPIEPGEQRLRTEGRAQRGLTDLREQTTLVEGLAALYFEVADVQDPVEVGGETTYEIRVVNQGSKACTNIRVAVQIPAAMSPIDAQGPAAYDLRGQEFQFQPLPRLAPKAEIAYRIRVRGNQPGDHRVSVQVSSAEISTPVTKEESTRVYAD